jgi:HK97 family phage portal protein
MMQSHLSLRGNAYAQVVYSGSQVVALVPCHPDRTTVEQIGEGRYRYRVTDWMGKERVLMQDEVLHLKQLAMDGFNGMSTVAAQKEPIGTALTSQDYSGRFFANGARHSGTWIEFPGKFADPAARARFREAFRASQAGENAYTTPVLDQGMKMHELGMTNADAQYIESRRYSDSDLCRMFLVPPHMVGILDRATNNNIEHQGREFYSNTLMGLLRRWEESLEATLLTEQEQDEGIRLEFDVDEITRADSATRWKIYHDAVLDGILTPNEVRARERYAPLDGLDEVIQPMNAQTPSQRAEPPASGAPPAQQPPPPDRTAREQALLNAAADRCVTREVNEVTKILHRFGSGAKALGPVADFYGTHADWMARALAITPAAAAVVCEARFDELRLNDTKATLERWSDERGRLLLATFEPEALRPDTDEERRHGEQVRLLTAIEEQMRIPVVVNVPPQAAPQVAVTVPEQAPPVVQVNVPQQAAPVVNVAPTQVTVEAAEPVAAPPATDPPWPTQTTVEKRDDKGRPMVYTTRPLRR